MVLTSWTSRWYFADADNLQQVDYKCMVRSAVGSNPSLRTTLWSLCGIDFMKNRRFTITELIHGRLARWIKWRACEVDEVTERLENELCYDYNYELCSFSNFSVTSLMSQLILQPFRRFTYVTAHSLTLPLFHLRHSLFSNLLSLLLHHRIFTYVT